MLKAFSTYASNIAFNKQPPPPTRPRILKIIWSELSDIELKIVNNVFIVLKMCIRCVLLSNAVYLFWIPNQIARRYEELLLSGDVYAINQLEKNYASSGNSPQISLSESDVNSKAGGNSGPASANQKGRWLQINRTNLVEC